jgi:hypothetical protein
MPTHTRSERSKRRREVASIGNARPNITQGPLRSSTKMNDLARKKRKVNVSREAIKVLKGSR